MDFKIYNRTKLIPRKFLSGGKYKEDWADKAEPWASGLGLSGSIFGLATAATGFGAPLGVTIAAITNIPNAVIDAYQMGRDWYRAYKDKNIDTITDASINTAELALDLVGLKLLKVGIDLKADKEFTREVSSIVRELIRKREGLKFMLRKKGMTDALIAVYIAEKATNAAMNSKHIHDYAKNLANKKLKQIQVGKHIINIPTNAFHVMDAFNEEPLYPTQPVLDGDPLGLFEN